MIAGADTKAVPGQHVSPTVRAVLASRAGATAIEWALIAAVIALPLTPVMPRVASGLAASFNAATDRGLATPPPCIPNPHWSDPGARVALAC